MLCLYWIVNVVCHASQVFSVFSTVLVLHCVLLHVYFLCHLLLYVFNMLFLWPVTLLYVCDKSAQRFVTLYCVCNKSAQRFVTLYCVCDMSASPNSALVKKINDFWRFGTHPRIRRIRRIGCHQLRLGTSLPRTPGVRMTWVRNKLPQNNGTEKVPK